MKIQLGVEKNTIKMLFILALLAFSTGMLFILFIPQPEVGQVGDSYDYINLAKNIISGNGYKDETGLTSVARPPLYPFVLSIIFSLFSVENFVVVRIFNVFFHCVTTIFTFLISRYFLTQNIAFLCRITVAFNPYLIFNTGFVLTESFLTMMITLSFFSLIKSIKSFKWQDILITGFLWGLLVLTKAVSFIYPFLVVILITIVLQEKKDRLKLVVYLLVFCCTIAPWTIRNYIVTKKFLLVDTKGGWVFYAATLPVKRIVHWGYLPQQKQIVEEMDKMGLTNPVDRDRYLTKAAIKNILQNPLQYVKLVFWRIIKFTTPYRYWQVLMGYSKIGVYSVGYICMVFINLIFFSTVIVNFISTILNKKFDLQLFIISSGVIYYWILYSLISDGAQRFAVPLYPLVIINMFYLFYF
ncbi:MAG: glycosyltransferase family 39 protein [Endomicrobia bacterium]|nr:glycosyltransferase family 39 protein [Endomicrobiia bacterium]